MTPSEKPGAGTPRPTEKQPVSPGGSAKGTPVLFKDLASI